MLWLLLVIIFCCGSQAPYNAIIDANEVKAYIVETCIFFDVLASAFATILIFSYILVAVGVAVPNYVLGAFFR